MSDGAVLDSSAVLALLRGEPGAERVAREVPGGALNVVNLAEVLTVLVRHGVPLEAAAGSVDLLALQLVPADAELARAAAATVAAARGRGAGLSLGDAFCLATGMALGQPVLTADRAWGKVGVGVKVVVIR